MTELDTPDHAQSVPVAPTRWQRFRNRVPHRVEEAGKVALLVPFFPLYLAALAYIGWQTRPGSVRNRRQAQQHWRHRERDTQIAGDFIRPEPPDKLQQFDSEAWVDQQGPLLNLPPHVRDLILYYVYVEDTIHIGTVEGKLRHALCDGPTLVKKADELDNEDLMIFAEGDNDSNKASGWGYDIPVVQCSCLSPATALEPPRPNHDAIRRHREELRLKLSAPRYLTKMYLVCKQL